MHDCLDMLELTTLPCLTWPSLIVRDDPLSHYRTEFDYLCRTLRRLGAAPDDVEDLAHEVFLVLHDKGDRYDPTRPLRPYLFGIAYRVVLKHRRRHREQTTVKLESTDPGIGPDQQIELEQKRRIVLTALESIPYPRRAVLVMHELDDIPMQQVAKALRIPLFTAYSRLRKARREFEQAISEHREEWS